MGNGGEGERDENASFCLSVYIATIGSSELGLFYCQGTVACNIKHVYVGKRVVEAFLPFYCTNHRCFFATAIYKFVERATIFTKKFVATQRFAANHRAVSRKKEICKFGVRA